ncbi:uncharacterized protein LOC116344365 [Contarinia nasturtii]|uniref:uncharacterized protein LOC116344365 n=1 Tax=Contarinia nasturtii TaxID=265458 RepID=UPI0012D444E5|nr:uncharacterized protein LOC116344365 [Contarinia nasturtii]
MLSIDVSEESDGSDSSYESDLIDLHAFGKITQWKFPNVTYCPMSRCRLLFGVRSDAILHYKKRHTNHSVYCHICDKPISTYSKRDFKKHYQRLHPKEQCPYDSLQPGKTSKLKETTDLNTNEIVEEDIPEEISTDQIDDMANDANDETSKVDGSKKFLCPLKMCNYASDQSVQIQQHWSQEHYYLRFPEIRSGIEITDETTLPNTNEEVQRQFDSDDSLLVPLHACEESTTGQSVFKCHECKRVFRSGAGLKKHEMVKHNIHSTRSAKKNPKRKHQSEDPIKFDTGVSRENQIKKEQMSEPEHSDADDENMTLAELMKNNAHLTKCRIILEKVEPTDLQVNPIEMLDEDQPQAMEQEDTLDMQPLDLTLPKRKESYAEPMNIVHLSDTDDETVILSDDTDNEDENQNLNMGHIIEDSTYEVSSDTE